MGKDHIYKVEYTIFFINPISYFRGGLHLKTHGKEMTKHMREKFKKSNMFLNHIVKYGIKPQGIKEMKFTCKKVG